MGLYARHVLPRLVHYACGHGPAERERGRVVPAARGRVLEVGIGSGLNLPHYDPQAVERVWGVDPSGELLARARDAADRAPFPVELLEGAADEALPIAPGSIDTVVVTWSLCTIPRPEAALAAARRALAPGGSLLFLEHGRSTDAPVRRWQERMNPLWGRCAGGCRLDRDPPALVVAAGFRLEELDAGYVPGPRFASYVYRGRASVSGPAAS